MATVNLIAIKDKYTTSQTKKLNISWEEKILPVYRIPLEYLYYNDLNDRIATYISKYNATEKSDITELPVDKRNDIIQEYIIDSDKEHFKKTKDNIESFWQLEPWVVLSDWRILDGNRRFTCLRKLHKDTWEQKFDFFETVILDNVDEKQIKILELMIQQWKEERVDYNPIEKLVWVYRDIIKDKKLTIKEYAKYTDKPESVIKNMVWKAELMVDFLEYINAPEEFYIAKDLELDAPLSEILNIKKWLWNDIEKWSKVRIAVYDMMLLKTKNDANDEIKFTIRDFWKKIVKNENRFNSFYEKQKEANKELHKSLEKEDKKVTTKFIREDLRWNKNIANNANNLVVETLYEAKKDDIKLLPIEQIREISLDLNNIDVNILSKLKGEDKQEFSDNLEKIQNTIIRLQKILENGI